MRFFRNLGLSLASGFVLCFFSERLFWSAFRPGDSIGDLVVTWLAYSVLACLLINVVSRFRVHRAEQVFLAGAIYGWLAEGALVGTLYGTEASAPFPVSIVCTGLSWHALISVLVGWHFLRRSFLEFRPWKALGWSAGIGLFWGLWGTFLWREAPPVIVSIPAFATHAFVCTVLLMLSYAVMRRLPPESSRPGWIGLGFSVLLLGVFYVQQVRSLGFLPLILLPVLVGGALLILRKARQVAPEPASGTRADPPAMRNLLCLLAIPITATSTYAIQYTTGFKGIPPIVIFAATAIVSLFVMAWALFRIRRILVRS